MIMLTINQALSLLAIVQATISLSTCALGHEPVAATAAANQRLDLESICKHKLDLKSLREYRRFVNGLKSLSKEDAGKSSHLKRCLEEKESIVALQELIDAHDKKRPCKLSEITNLELYARKYLLNNKRAITFKFFSLFGVSVGIYCKINLLAHLKQADGEADQLDFIYSMASPTGWNALINEYTKKSMKFGTSGHADSHVINRIAKLVPGLSQLDHLDFVDFDHVMDDDKARAAGLNKNGSKGIEVRKFEIKNAALQPKVLESLGKISEACQNLDKFYVNSVLSMAKLRELGLLVDLLNDLHDHSALLHKWLAVASFCQLMARVRIVSVDGGTKSSIQLELLHDDKLLEGRRKLYSYAAPFDEIHPMARELVWQAGVNEGSWRQKSEAMWLQGDTSGQSVAMKRLGQFVKGVEHDFQEELDNDG